MSFIQDCMSCRWGSNCAGWCSSLCDKSCLQKCQLAASFLRAAEGLCGSHCYCVVKTQDIMARAKLIRSNICRMLTVVSKPSCLAELCEQSGLLNAWQLHCRADWGISAGFFAVHRFAYNSPPAGREGDAICMGYDRWSNQSCHQCRPAFVHHQPDLHPGLYSTRAASTWSRITCSTCKFWKEAVSYSEAHNSLITSYEDTIVKVHDLDYATLENTICPWRHRESWCICLVSARKANHLFVLGLNWQNCN